MGKSRKNLSSGNLKMVAGVVIVIIVFAVLIWMFLILQPQKPEAPAGAPSDARVNSTMSRLDEGVRVSLAAPDTARWYRGDSIEYVLGISNEIKSAQTFYSNIYLYRTSGDISNVPINELPEANEWFTFDRISRIGAEGKEFVDITALIPDDARFGVYLFKIVVCTEEDCTDINSNSLYSSTSFTIGVAE